MGINIGKVSGRPASPATFTPTSFPRWNGDINFMTIKNGNVRIIPQAIERSVPSSATRRLLS